MKLQIPIALDLCRIFAPNRSSGVNSQIMNVFFSWSGDRSKAVAAALVEWIPLIVPAVNPLFSPEIEKGDRWLANLTDQLQKTDFGIVCLTADNLREPWILYEAGALSKTAESRVWTFLVGVKHIDIGGPLGAFQHTLATKVDFLRLLTSIISQAEKMGESAPTVGNATRHLDKYWPEIEAALNAASQIEFTGGTVEPLVPNRNSDDMITELLDTVRLMRADLSAKFRPDDSTLHFVTSNRGFFAEKRFAKMIVSVVTEEHETAKQAQTDLYQLLRDLEPPVLVKSVSEGRSKIKGVFDLTVSFVNPITDETRKFLAGAIGDKFGHLIYDFSFGVA